MYEWSKLLMEKIKNAKCLNERDLRAVEVALRLYDIQEMILDEAIGLEDNGFELKHKCRMRNENGN